METNNKKIDEKEQFDYDFRKLQFKGPKKDAIKSLIILCVFLLLAGLGLGWLFMEHFIPMLSTAAGRKLILKLGLIVKTWKGGSSP